MDHCRRQFGKSRLCAKHLKSDAHAQTDRIFLFKNNLLLSIVLFKNAFFRDSGKRLEESSFQQMTKNGIVLRRFLSVADSLSGTGLATHRR
jgi:hypothetical protein